MVKARLYDLSLIWSQSILLGKKSSLQLGRLIYDRFKFTNLDLPILEEKITELDLD